MDIVSHCPLPVAVRPYMTARGARFVLVVCKATFLLSPAAATLHATQEPILEDDRRWDDKSDRSVFAPSDMIPFKRDVDVVLVGHAFAAGGVPARSIMTRICVGDVDKSIEVYGDRLFTPHGELRDGPRITRARLRYERAPGGPGTTNPVGMRHDKKDLFGAVALPSLQLPGLHVTRPEDLVEPVGYGPIAPEWPTRASRLGHLANWFSPARWYESPLPDEIEPSFFNVAPPDQRLRELRPDERIVLEGLTPEQPRFVTQLPALVPKAVAERVNGRRDQLHLRADTLWIDTSRRLCTVTWRASVALMHPSDTGRIVVTLGLPETSRVYAKHDPALLATPMATDELDASATLTINPLGPKRPVTPFDAQQISAPETADMLPTDPALIDDEETFVQTDDVKSNTLPFVASQTKSTDRASNIPTPPSYDRALPFAAPPPPPPTAPGLPFVAAPPPAPQSAPPPPARASSPQLPRDLPFFSPAAYPGQTESAVFPAPGQPPPSAVFPAPRAPSPSVPFPAPPVAAPSAVFPAPSPSVPFPAPPVAAPSAVFPAPSPAATSFSPSGPMLGYPAPSAPAAAPPPPAAPLDMPPEAPPLIGPLATPEMYARSAPPTPTNNAAPTPPEEKPAPAPTANALPLEEFPIERCACITASIARRKDDRAQILEAEKLDNERFSRIQAHWYEAISAETDRGKTKLLEKFDAAYVGRLEEERGPIQVQEFARIVVAAERGRPDPTLRELGLPPSALMRIERVFLGRTARDLDLAQRVLRAIETERDA